VKIGWRDVWLGAALTAVLSSIGKFILGLYLGSGAAGSAYGAETRRTAVPIKVWVRIDLLMGQRPYLCLLVWRKAAAKQQAEQGPALGCQEWEERVRLANGRFHCQSAPGQRGGD
jgi:hypothetical protein